MHVVDPQRAAEHLRRRVDVDGGAASHRAVALRALLPRARSILVDEFGAARVVLFGSLARGDVHAGSDVDLCVEGLDVARQFAAAASLNSLFGSCVDLVRLEDAGASLRARVEAEGISL